MIDLGQYIPRIADPLKWDWFQVQGIAERGELCVIRSVSSIPTILRIDPQTSWREWVGVFSAI